MHFPLQTRFFFYLPTLFAASRKSFCRGRVLEVSLFRRDVFRDGRLLRLGQPPGQKFQSCLCCELRETCVLFALFSSSATPPRRTRRPPKIITSFARLISKIPILFFLFFFLLLSLPSSSRSIRTIPILNGRAGDRKG